MEKLELINVKDSITLYNFLKDNYISKNLTDKLMAKKHILLDEKTLKKNRKLKNGDKIIILIDDEENNIRGINGNLEILYEDEDILCVIKPRGICMHSYNIDINLDNYISYIFKERGLKRKVRFINRLDMDTRGIVLVAKNPIIQNYFDSEDSCYEKYYIAIIEGNINNSNKIFAKEENCMTLYSKYDDILKKQIISEEFKVGYKKTITKFKILETYENYSIVEVKLETGRTHQIRATFSHLGYPLLGDKLYGSKSKINTFNLINYKVSFRSFRKKENCKIRNSYYE